MRQQSARKRRQRKTRPSTGATSKPSKLVLLGDPDRSVRIARALKNLDVELTRAEEERRMLDAGTIGVVIVTPLAGRVSVSQVVSAIRESRLGRALPVFAIVDDNAADRTARQIYSAGATAVFYWPREALLLGRLVAELLGVTLVRGRAQKPQAALERTVKAHLRLAPWSTDGVRVKAVGAGEVHISGSAATFRRKKELERMIARVPGVTRVVSRDLWVQPSELTDDQVTRAVRSVLRSTTTVDEATVSVAVHNGTVALAGTVVDRQELRRIEGMIANVKGVRDMDSSLVVSSTAKQTDGAVARRLNDLISKWFPEDRVNVAVFAQVAVLSGTVPRLSRRLEIEALVDQDPSIERVLNKIDIV